MAAAIEMAAPAHAAERPAFGLPVKCDGNRACLLQNYMDMDSGPRRRDPVCGAATYDGHKGTDLRVVSLPQLRTGIKIFAMADGVVGGSRNNSADKLIRTKADRDAVKDIECGNGALIDHGVIGNQRWTTQYCHMKKGSMVVKRGDRVRRGQYLGDMGVSGFTTFPHIHITVRRGKTPVDPFTGLDAAKGRSCEPGFGETLFDAASLRTLLENDSPILQTGFAGKPVTRTDIVQEAIEPPIVNSPLVYYAFVKHLRKGDQLRLTIVENDKPFVTTTTKPMKSNKAVFTAYTGRKSGWKSGATYRGTVEILRNNNSIFTSLPKMFDG